MSPDPALVEEWLQCARDIKALTKHKEVLADAISQEMEAGDEVGTRIGAVRMQPPQRKWDAELAKTVLPPDLRAMCEVVVLDGARAKRYLPPDLVDQCRSAQGSPYLLAIKE